VNRRPGPCRHCGRPVAFDPQGKPIHTSREYACRDRWGVLTNTHAELHPSVGRAAVPTSSPEPPIQEVAHGEPTKAGVRRVQG